MGSNWLILLFLFLYSSLSKSGIHAATDFPFSSPEIIQSYLSSPQMWSFLTGPFGSNQGTTLWSWLYGVTLGFFSVIGVSHNWIVIFSVFLILIIGSTGIFKLGKLLNLSTVGKIISAFFYLSNTYILLLVDGGQILWALAYSYLPLCFYLVENKILQKKYLSVLEIFLVVFITFFDLRAGYLLAVILIARFMWGFVRLSKTEYSWWIKFWLFFAVKSGILLAGLHAYWWFPLYMSESAGLPSGLINNLNGDFQTFTSLKHSLLFYQPHWYQNVFGLISSPRKEFLLIPLLVLIGFWAKRKNLLAIFLLLLSVTGVFLAKGPQEPLGAIFNFLFTKVPGFFVFRDPTKFFVFIALGYSLLIGSAVDFLKDKVPSRFRFFPGLLIIGFLLFLATPVFLGWTHGLFAPSPFYQQYSEFEGKVKQLNEGKVLWIPGKTPGGYMDLKHLAINGVDLVSLRPFVTGTKGTYETLNFLREASYSGELLKISGIGYLAYPPLDPRLEYKADQIVYHDVFLGQLKNQKWVLEELDNSGIPLLKLDNPEKLFFVPDKTFLVVGSDLIYGEATKSADASLSKNSLIFLDEKSGLINNIPSSIHSWLLYKTESLDLLMALVNQEKFAFPAKSLKSSPDETGWWKRESKDLLSFKDFLIQKYGVVNQDFDLGGGFAIAEGDKSLIVPLKANTGDKLFLRALQSTRSGQLKIDYGSQKMNPVNLNTSGDIFLWKEVGTFNQQIDSITIHSAGDINILNGLVVLSDKEYSDLELQIKKYSEKEIVYKTLVNSPERNKVNVDFVKINNDQYKITVQGITKPSVIVFAQSYDPQWQLNGQKAFPVYSIFNGFVLEKDGEYLVEYSPHQYIKYGLLISLTTLLGLSGLIIWKKFVKH